MKHSHFCTIFCMTALLAVSGCTYDSIKDYKPTVDDDTVNCTTRCSDEAKDKPGVVVKEFNTNAQTAEECNCTYECNAAQGYQKNGESDGFPVCKKGSGIDCQTICSDNAATKEGVIATAAAASAASEEECSCTYACNAEQGYQQNGESDGLPVCEKGSGIDCQTICDGKVASKEGVIATAASASAESEAECSCTYQCNTVAGYELDGDGTDENIICRLTCEQECKNRINSEMIGVTIKSAERNESDQCDCTYTCDTGYFDIGGEESDVVCSNCQVECENTLDGYDKIEVKDYSKDAQSVNECNCAYKCKKEYVQEGEGADLNITCVENECYTECNNKISGKTGVVVDAASKGEDSGLCTCTYTCGSGFRQTGNDAEGYPNCEQNSINCDTICKSLIVDRTGIVMHSYNDSAQSESECACKYDCDAEHGYKKVGGSSGIDIVCEPESTECQCTSPTPYCNNEECVECLTDAHCNSAPSQPGDTPYCSVISGYKCVQKKIVGDACESDSECEKFCRNDVCKACGSAMTDTGCGEGNYCDEAFICTPKGNIGSSCKEGVQCLTGYCDAGGTCACNTDTCCAEFESLSYWSNTLLKCVHKKAKGDTCTKPDECETGYCNGQCVDPPECQCSDDEYCDSSKTCQPKIKYGLTCGGNNNECETNYCKDNKCECTNETCCTKYAEGKHYSSKKGTCVSTFVVGDSCKDYNACGTGMYCANADKTCKNKLNADGDCKDGTTGNNNACLSGTCNPKNGSGQYLCACTADRYTCPSPKTCKESVCVEPCSLCDSATEYCCPAIDTNLGCKSQYQCIAKKYGNAECKNGDMCLSGVCSEKDVCTCNNENDCVFGYYCDLSGKCVEKQKGGSDCTANYQCISNNCFESHCGCKSEGDCIDNMTCFVREGFNNKCVECLTTADCPIPSDEYCSEYKCKKQVSFPCSIDDDCFSGHCSRAKDRCVCREDEECAANGENMYCGNEYCYSKNNWGSGCNYNNECVSGYCSPLQPVSTNSGTCAQCEPITYGGCDSNIVCSYVGGCDASHIMCRTDLECEKFFGNNTMICRGICVERKFVGEDAPECPCKQYLDNSNEYYDGVITCDWAQPNCKKMGGVECSSDTECASGKCDLNQSECLCYNSSNDQTYACAYGTTCDINSGLCKYQRIYVQC